MDTSEKRLNFSKRLFFILVPIFLMVLILTVFLSQPEQPSLALPEETVMIPREYTLYPKENTEPLIPKQEQSSITTSPKNYLRYALIHLWENFNVISNSYTPLFLAEKRVQEMERFKNTLIYSENIKDPPWNPFSWKYTFNSWQAMFHRYKNNINKDAESLSNQLHPDLIRQRIDLVIEHHNRIRSAIFSSSLDTTKQNTLGKNIDTIIQSYLTSIIPMLSGYNQIPYSTSEIASDREWGIYEINQDRLDSKSIRRSYIQIAPPDTKKQTIQFTKTPLQSFKPNWTAKIIPNQENTKIPKVLTYESLVPINPNPQTQYDLVIHTQSAMSQLFCPQNLTGGCFQPISVQLIRIYLSKRKPIEEVLSSANFYPFYPSRQLLIRFTSPEKSISNEKYFLRFTTSNSSVRSVFENANLFFYEAQNNTVIAKKIHNSLIPKRITLQTIDNTHIVIHSSGLSTFIEEDLKSQLPAGWGMKIKFSDDKGNISYEVSYLPFNVLFYCTKLLLIFIFAIGYYTIHRILVQKKPIWIDYLFSKPTYERIKSILVFPFRMIWKTIDAFCIRFRTVFLLLAFIGIVWNILFFETNSDTVTTVFTFLWAGALIGYRAESRNTFFMALIYLLCTPFFLILQQEFIAEKSAIWAYMMLVVGTLGALVEIKKPSLVLVQFPQFYYDRFIQINEIVRTVYTQTPAQNIAHRIKSSTIKIIHTIARLITNFIGEFPKSKKDFITFAYRFTLFSVVTIFIVVSFVFTSLFIIRKSLDLYSQYRDWRGWISIKPRIFRIEPSIIYPGMKVVMYGKNFGWNERVGYRIETDQSPYVDLPDLWNDTKIIFTVPLHWNIGKHPIIITKPVFFNNSYVQNKSNPFELNIIPRKTKFTEADDAFFEEMNRIGDEARKINGYE